MISQKKRILFKLFVLSALFVPLASPAETWREKMFGPRAPQAPAGLREQAREARIARIAVERELDREISQTGGATIATIEKAQKARDAQQWLDWEVDRQASKAKQQAYTEARVQANMQKFVPNQSLEQERTYRRWRATGPMFAVDAPEYTAKQQADRARDIEIMRLEDLVARKPEIEKAYADPAALNRRSQLSDNYLNALHNYNDYGSRAPKWWRKWRLDRAEAKLKEANAEDSRIVTELIGVREEKEELDKLKIARIDERQREYLGGKIARGETLNSLEQRNWDYYQERDRKNGVATPAIRTPAALPAPVVLPMPEPTIVTKPAPSLEEVKALQKKAGAAAIIDKEEKAAENMAKKPHVTPEEEAALLEREKQLEAAANVEATKIEAAARLGLAPLGE